MKITLKKILSSLAAVATLFLATAGTAFADRNDLFVSINAVGTTFGNGTGAIYQYTPAGAQSTFLSSLNRPRGLVFDQAGNLFLATNTSDSSGATQGAIVQIAPDGTMTTFASAFLNNHFLEEIAFDSAGNLFVNSTSFADPDVLSGVVFKVAPDGTVTTFATLPGQSFGVAVDSSDHVFAASGHPDRTIYKFTPAGVRTVFAGPTNFSGAQSPIGLMFDSAGNLFASTAEAGGNGEILKFAPDGTKTVFAKA